VRVAGPSVPTSCDLLIIGGGINGLAVAADAAARGLDVVLVEKGDFGGGTTAASSRLIHGGLRYLQYGELGLVRESLRERGLLVRNRPHRVRPIRLLLPVRRDGRPAAWKVGVGLALYAVLAHDPLFPLPGFLSPVGAHAEEPGLALDGIHAAFTCPDAQVEFPERLCVELLREAGAAGAVAVNHTRVTGLLQESRPVCGALLRDELTGAETEIRAGLVLNAAGPWVDAVTRLLAQPSPRLLGGTWGTHVVLPPHPAGPRGPVYATARRDGRPFFVLPWDGRLLVGTTDVPYSGDPDALTAPDAEVEYLVAETDHLFPGCGYTPAAVQHTTIGVRPLPESQRGASAVTRRHFLVDHARRDGIAGLVSLVGGKLTTHRSLAESTVDWVFQARGWDPPPCPTRRTAPTPDPIPALNQAEVRLGLSPTSSSRLLRVYGPSVLEVLDRAEQDPELARPLAPNCPALGAEVVHAVQAEQARTVEDVALRRLMLLPPPAEALAQIGRILAATSTT
jgi:glycerol-3-phosphate dehydrogenase